MHPHPRIAAGDDFGFGCGKFAQPLANDLLIRKRASQFHIRRVMPRFGLEQAAVEVGQFAVFQVVPQQAETLTTARFDQRSNKQTIDRTLRFAGANQLVQLRALVAGL